MVQSDPSPPASFDQHSGDVYGWAYRILGHHHDALDVVQDVFLRWSKQCSHAQPQQVRGWLRRVTINRAIDLQRDRRLKLVNDDSARESPEGASAENAPDAESDTAALRTAIVSALDRLTDIQRSVLVAKVYEESTFATIAAELDLAVSTVKTHYLRALRTVRDCLHARWSKEYAT